MDWLIAAVETAFFRNVAFLVGVMVAVLSVISVRATARRKQSADVIFATRNDELLRKGIRLIREEALHENSNIRKYARAPEAQSENAAAIRYVLNHFEYVAVGIRNGIYDEGMFKEASYSTIMEIRRHSETYIADVRTEQKRDTIYQEFCWLCERWKKKPLKPRSK
ncbi:DUF4760 domain-containing protein [Stenotrophomonas maltophilia]|uniref:DUF4760 domain-containing protein n=1 Tax=Stenotrophomonas maltophilia TaxID=40324 RepID=UPI001F26FC11|nr:DUF4760 domain-containing protein [Stenotrophomonas maltophilia]MCF3479581.1 DUF4760 domain-containing protein [Stenotrophomonas maltophilia]MDH0072195.1 DUF4760 domain-containing protein [Stenotrophomonas maltophilia]MDH0104953.1 DUF4760 domain-containing protein [Stenotrophomonas maltophilia]MDH0330578.1 DUF4760 domain-containing protein [Stenotrophomonas maltophilia]MDH0632239.1 DUF4760 domain-containing protein [Stenotrophomonas maltophilia]